MVARTSAQQIAFRYRTSDSTSGVPRDPAKRLAQRLGVDETQAIHQPRWIGIGVAWACGLLTDVVEANLFGQHALAYAILGFAASYFHRRVLRFPLWQQALHVLGLLIVAQLVVLVLRLMSGATVPTAAMVLSSVSSALIWPVVSALLQWPQRVRSLLD